MNQQYYKDDHLAFLKGKIVDIRRALFKAEINSELQLPNNIIQTLRVDDDGSIWFLTSCCGYQAKNIEKSFYAYLDFYKKGTGCRLRVGGKANIMDDEDDFLSMSDYSESVAERLVLVKMKIMQAEYFENKMEPAGSIKEKVKTMFNQLFLSNPHRHYNFS